MDLDWIEDFLVLQEVGSFTLAAERRNSSQSAFSRRIKSLEDWLGVTLIDRSVRPPRLTQVATEHQAELQRALSRFYELRSLVRGEQSRTSRLRMAVQHSLSISLVPNLVDILRKNGYQPAYHIRCGNRDECIESVLRSEADLLICYDAENERAFRRGTDLELLATGRDAMLLVGRPGITLDEDSKVALLAYPHDSFFGGVVWKRVMAEMTSTYRCETVCTSAFSSAIREMVLTALGIAWLPGALIADDLASGRLAVLGGSRLQCDMQVAIYGPASDQDPFDKLLRRILRGVDLTSVLSQNSVSRM
jgi:DNA-binding transcriptional LysR family regulator